MIFTVVLPLARHDQTNKLLFGTFNSHTSRGEQGPDALLSSSSFSMASFEAYDLELLIAEDDDPPASQLTDAFYQLGLSGQPFMKPVVFSILYPTCNPIT